MTTTPERFETALTEAEAEAFAYLAEATKTVPGKTALLAHNPGVADAWTFELTTPLAEASLWSAHDLPGIAWQAIAVARFRNRDRAQRWLMQLIQALPLAESGVLIMLRVRAAGEIGLDDFVVQKRVLRLWTVVVTMDAVFRTGGKAGVQT